MIFQGRQTKEEKEAIKRRIARLLKKGYRLLKCPKCNANHFGQFYSEIIACNCGYRKDKKKNILGIEF